MVAGLSEREAGRLTYGRLGKPGEQLLACPGCFTVAVPRRVEVDLVECVKCRARFVSVYAAERGIDDLSGMRGPAREIRERPELSKMQREKQERARARAGTGDQAVRDLRGDARAEGPGSALRGAPKGKAASKSPAVRGLRKTEERDGEKSALQGLLFEGRAEPKSEAGT